MARPDLNEAASIGSDLSKFREGYLDCPKKAYEPNWSAIQKASNPTRLTTTGVERPLTAEAGKLTKTLAQEDHLLEQKDYLPAKKGHHPPAQEDHLLEQKDYLPAKKGL